MNERDYPDMLTVGDRTWTIRRYTPKRRGGPAGHGWVRDSNPGSMIPRIEVSGGECELLNEIARLRRELDDVELERWQAQP